MGVLGSGKGPDKADATQAEPESLPPAAPTAEPRPKKGPWNHNPFVTGFLLAAGALLAYWFGGLILRASSVLILIVVSLFLASGLNPVVDWFMRRGLRRSVSVVAVIVLVVAAVGLFVTAIVPVISDQVAALTKNAPEWLDQLQRNRQVQRWNNDYQLIDKIKDYIADGGFAQKAFGGVLGLGLVVLGALLSLIHI